MMKRLFLTIFLLSGIWSSAFGLGTKDTVTIKLDNGNGTSRGGNSSYHASDGRLVKFFGQDTSTSANASPRVAYSTDGGETWTVTAQADQLGQLESSSIAWNWSHEGDTLWLIHSSHGTGDLAVFKIVDGAVASRDTITTTTTAGSQYCLFPTINGGTEGGLFAAMTNTGSYLKPARIDGVFPNTWTLGTDSVLSVGSFSGDFKWCHVRDSTVVLITMADNMDVYTLSPNDFRSNQTNFNSSVASGLFNWITPHGRDNASDSLLLIAYTAVGTGHADTALWLLRALWHGDGTEGLTKLDSVMISSETERPTYTGTVDSCAPQPVVMVDADFPERVVVFYKYFPDTANRDRPNIAYKVSTDTGKTFGARIIVYDTTQMEINTAATPDSVTSPLESRITLMTGPTHFENGLIHVYFQNLLTEPVNLLFVSDQLASLSPDAGLPTKIYTPGVSGMIYKPGESGKRSKP